MPVEKPRSFKLRDFLFCMLSHICLNYTIKFDMKSSHKRFSKTNCNCSILEIEINLLFEKMLSKKVDFE